MFPSRILHILAQRSEDIDRIDAYLYDYSNRPSWGEMIIPLIFMVGLIYVFSFARKKFYERKLENKRNLKEQEPRVTANESSEAIDESIQKLAKEEQEVDKKKKLSNFEKKQQQKLRDLRDSLLNAMAGVARDNLRSAADTEADAEIDAYDRDFALNLLSQEQDALHEIEEALKRIDDGTYGICEMSKKKIIHARLEAIPFARYTVECQAQIESKRK